MLLAGVAIRWLVDAETLGAVQAEDRLIETGQAVLLGVGCLLCLWAMVRGRAGYWWWVAPAFICLFMCWREIELDQRYFRVHAFSWKYLADGRTPVSERLLLGIPSLGLSLVVLVVCLANARRIVATARRRDLRVGVWLFVVGLGLYLVAAGYDRAWGWEQDYGLYLPGFRGHRDDFWEEWLELKGAVAVLMGVLDHFRRRKSVGAAPPGTSVAAEEAPSP